MHSNSELESPTILDSNSLHGGGFFPAKALLHQNEAITANLANMKCIERSVGRKTWRLQGVDMHDSNLREFVRVNLDKTKQKYLRSLGIGNTKYVETLKMFENLAKIADSLCQGVDSDDEFEKLKHRVVPVHPLAVREISVWNAQIRRRLRRKAYVLVRELPMKIFEHMQLSVYVLRIHVMQQISVDQARKILYSLPTYERSITCSNKLVLMTV